MGILYCFISCILLKKKETTGEKFFSYNNIKYCKTGMLTIMINFKVLNIKRSGMRESKIVKWDEDGEDERR